jgi:phage gpG-like protein
MAGIRLQIDANTGALGAVLREAARRGADLRPGLALSGDVFENSTRARFDSGRGPGGIPWLPSNRARAESAPRAGQIGPQRGATLVRSGLLRDSIRTEVGDDTVRTGTDARSESAKYAATHQFGATIVPKTAKFLAFQIPGVGWRFAKSVTIPARPFMGIDDDDLAALEEVWTGFVASLFDD